MKEPLKKRLAPLSSPSRRTNSTMLLLPLLFVFNHLVLLSQCRRNVTVDDNDPQIQYSGDWGRSAETDLNYGRSHALTTNTSSVAVFQFAGVAVYFLSPLWPYAVSTALTLDSRPTIIVDLTDHNSNDTGGGPETVGSSTVWSAENLANTTHTLRISVGRGQQFAILDGIIYTILEPGESATTSASDSSGTVRDQVLPIALGTVLGVLALILIAIILWLCLRRRKDNHRRSSWRSSKSEGGAASINERGGNIPPLSPMSGPRSPPPAQSRPDSDYQPKETAWSTSSVGGPGVPNMTGIGASTRTSRIPSHHPSDHPSGHPAPFQSSIHAMDGYQNGSYASPTRDSRYPDI